MRFDKWEIQTTNKKLSDLLAIKWSIDSHLDGADVKCIDTVRHIGMGMGMKRVKILRDLFIFLFLFSFLTNTMTEREGEGEIEIYVLKCVYWIHFFFSQSHGDGQAK